MSADPIAVAYRRAMARYGELVTYRVETFHGDTDYQIRARVTGFRAEEINAGIELGARRVVVLAGAFPAGVHPSKGDRIILRQGTASERHLSIEEIDDSTRRAGGELIAFEMVATGP